MNSKTTIDCPSNSGKALAKCCNIYHEKKSNAPTAEALMRARYSAFVLRLSDYIWQTWDKETRPTLEQLGGLGLKWINLEIQYTELGQETDDTGKVHFLASFVGGNKGKILDEISEFIRDEDGQWVYLDGASKTTDISRNDPCPCDSDKKFKRCCLR